MDCCVAAPAVGLVKPTRRRRRPQARRYRAAASWRAAALADVAIASFLTAASDMRVVCTLTGRTDPRGQKRGLFQRFCRGRSWLKKRRKKYFSSGNLFSLHIACACRFGTRTFWYVHSGSCSLSCSPRVWIHSIESLREYRVAFRSGGPCLVVFDVSILAVGEWNGPQV